MVRSKTAVCTSCSPHACLSSLDVQEEVLKKDLASALAAKYKLLLATSR
jgi:hypothetical protein